MKKFLIYGLISLLSNTLFAQSIANYSTTRSTGVGYSSIASSGNPVNAWRNTGTLPQDDNRSQFIPIGFDFWYNGTRYTDFSLSTNGFLDFSTSTDDGGPAADDFGYNNAAFTNSTVGNETRPAIAPFYDDLTAAGGGAPLGNSIRYEVSGTAPNRVLTAEWINMAVYGNTAPDLDFQVKLYETTGVIEIIYDTMDASGYLFSYTTGINANTMSNPPLATQLKTLQTANSNTFSQTVQNNLSTMPAQRSMYTFTPPTPANPGGILTFTAIGSTGMTLNWANWATNEVGYVIYNSTDNLNFTFVTQTAANATSSAVTTLLPATTYYWRVYAVTEGRLSNALSGSQATNSGGNKTSTGTGNWNTAGTWTPPGVPTAADNVTIANGHTITINAAANCNKLTVGQGSSGILQFNGGTARTLTVNDSIIVKTGATFYVNTTSNVTHNLILNNHIVNNGTLNFATDANSLCNTSCSKNGSINLTGTGTTTRFNLLNLSLGTVKSNEFHINSTNFAAATNFLTLSNGTFKISCSGTVNITPFTALTTLNSKTKIWVNSSSVTLNTGAGVNLYGDLEISNGTLNIGDAANEDLTSYGGNITLSNGSLNIAGKLYTIDINNLINLNISGGTLTLPSVGSTSTTIAPFSITSTGSTLNLNNGTIVIPREGGSGAEDLGYQNTGSTLGTISGGTLQIGNGSSPAAQIISINSLYNIPNLSVASANVTARVLSNPLSIQNNISISAGTLNANNINISLGGNWNNSGGTFTPGNATVTFNGSSAQSIFKTGGETFYNLSLSGNGTKTLASNITCTNNFTIQSSSNLDVSSNSYSINIGKDFSNSGTLNTQSGTITLNGSSSQTLQGTSTTDFYNLSLNNTAGASLSSPANLKNALSISNGNFNTNGQAFTLLSTENYSGHITEITGTGNITGNVTVQRFVPGGSTGWAMMGFPFTSSQTFQDLDDDLFITCPTCPDGSLSFYSIYSYDETQSGVQDAPSSFVPMENITDPLTHTLGYYIYTGDGQFTTNDITLDISGTVGKFSTSIPLSYTNTGSATEDGWNLISNPYPCPILWSDLRAGNTNVANAIYVFNADLSSGAGGFASYVNGISSPSLAAGGISDTIPLFQGIFVKATAATTLTAQESYKVSGNPTFLRTGNLSETAGGTSLIRLILSGSGQANDETVLYYQEGASQGYDLDYDALKLSPFTPGIPQIALIGTDSNRFQINAIAAITNQFTAPVSVTSATSEPYTIHAEGTQSIPSEYCISLYDRYTNTSINLRDTSYTFTHFDTTQQARFELRINNLLLNPSSTCEALDTNTTHLPKTPLESPLNFYQDPEYLHVAFKFPNPINTRITLYNSTGQVMIQQQTQAQDWYKIPISQYATGIYFISIETKEQHYTHQFSITH